MKKQLYYGLMGLLFCAFTACSSNNDDNKKTENPTSATPRLTGYELHTNGTLESKLSNIKYDDQGRMVECTSSNVDHDTQTTSTYTLTITYQPRAIIFRNVNDATVPAETFTLDEKGRIVESKSTDEVNVFSYDANNQLTNVKSTVNNHSTETKITWQNGNIVRVVSSYKEINYTHNTMPINHFMSISNEISGYDIEDVWPILFKQGYYGAYPKNLIQSISLYEINPAGGAKALKGTSTNTYSFDKNRNVTKVTSSDGYEEVYTWK